MSARTLYQSSASRPRRDRSCRGCSLFSMVLTPFKIGPIPMGDIKKKTFIPSKEPGRISLGQSLKLLRCHPNWRKLAHSATCNTRLSLVTGEKPVGAYWGEIPFSRPLRSIRRGPFCCHPTTGSSLGEATSVYSSASLVCAFELGLSVQHAGPACQALKKTL